jgi:Pentapeptide repeats (8 copies)
MATTVEQPSIRDRRRKGLRGPSPDLIGKARDDTSTQISRIGLTFVGTVAFCLLSLLSPDSALLSGSEKLNVPLAGPVSFFGFMLLGPAVLIALRVYLQIYVEHSERLDLIAKRLPVGRAPALVPLKNPLIRVFGALTFYVLLPLAMLLFAYKAAVFPAWGSGLLCVAAAVIAIHLMLPLHRFSWRSKTFLSMGAAIQVLGAIAEFGPPRRVFDLFRANLTGANLNRADLRGADLSVANLSDSLISGADLSGADLTDAKLHGAILFCTNLSKADLSDANLSETELWRANLSDATLARTNLDNADLSGADLSKADLDSARNLTQKQLDKACGESVEGLDKLTIKPCPKDQESFCKTAFERGRPPLQ